jgi:hypothetical protein
MANVIIVKWGILPTYLPTTYQPTYLPTTYLRTYLYNLPTYLLTYMYNLFTYSPTYPPTHLYA